MKLKHLEVAVLWSVILFFRTVFSDITFEIRESFSAEAARHSFLGNAVDSITENENGYQQDFDGGAIFFLDSAFEVHGLILGKYQQLLGPWGYLGFPVSDELTCKDGEGRYSVFQNGSIYYHPVYGTHQVTGSMLAKWQMSGADTGSLGYPVADPVICDTGMIQQFQHGYLSVKCPTVDMRQHMYSIGMRVRNQGWRGTCSVFAMTCLLEYAYAQLLGGAYIDLSEEYLNHVANLASGQTDDGSCFAPVASGYDSYGIVPEPYIPYDLNQPYNFSTFNLPQATVAIGREVLVPSLKLKEIVIKPGCPFPSSMGLSDLQMESIFTELNKGYPVAVGRGHSLVVVGYVSDPLIPRGGFFIIRNSYGPDADDHGYRYETYEHLMNTVYDAHVYELPYGVAFTKVLKGRVVNESGTGVQFSEVKVYGTTSEYGLFVKYDTTDADGCYTIPKIISLASNVTIQVTDYIGTLITSAELIIDTTVQNFVHITTDNKHNLYYDKNVSSVVDVRLKHNSGIEITLPYLNKSEGTVRIFGLNGKLLQTNKIPPGVRHFEVPYCGSKNTTLLYSINLSRPALKRSGFVR